MGVIKRRDLRDIGVVDFKGFDDLWWWGEGIDLSRKRLE